ncbi:MAG: nucleoside-triphosphatase [Promethearchaeota archaeon]|jgi:nucleoside-triphosphatase
MKFKILITGPPRCGKSTLIKRLIAYCNERSIHVDGFLTPEVRTRGIRIGFDIELIDKKERKKLARIGEHNTGYKLGKYDVFVNQLEEIISKLENIDLNKLDILFIDEIGKMELFSSKFVRYLRELFNMDLSIIATIGERMNHPIKDEIINKPNVVLFTLSRASQDEVFWKMLSLLKIVKD